MADLVFVAVIIVFFGLCGGLVKACDRIIGPDEGQLDVGQDAELEAERSEIATVDR
jgi:hypothetical protein